MIAIEAAAPPDPGTLAKNYMFVDFLRSSLGRTDGNLAAVVKSFRGVVREHCWRHWRTPEGRDVTFTEAEFRRFLEVPWPDGCGTKVDVVRKLLRGTDILVVFVGLIRWEPGRPIDESTPRTEEGKFSSHNRDIVTVMDEDSPTTIPRPRDYSRAAPTGHSVSYALRRLERDRRALYERVLAGELSAYRAMVLAGFKAAQITLPLNPVAAARLLRKHFKGGDMAALLRFLTVEDG